MRTFFPALIFVGFLNFEGKFLLSGLRLSALLVEISGLAKDSQFSTKIEKLIRQASI